MSKRLRPLTVFLTIAIVLGSLCLPASAVKFKVGDTIGTGKATSVINKNLTSDGAVTYAKAVYTDSANHKQAVHAIEFNPKTSDYMPYVYSKFTGTGCDVLSSAQQAESQFGADVIAGLNANFYSTSTGSTYAGYWVHDGRLAQASAGLQNDIITFNTDGTYKIVNSKLDFKLYIDGKEITYGGSSSIAHINKKSLADNVSDKFYYWDTECGTKTDSVIEGTEILCKKQDFGELTIGGTLRGKVIEVRKNTFYQPVAADEFVLYVKNGSPLMDKIASVAKDSIVEISVIETIEAARPYTENANAALAAQYKIVENGEFAPDSDTTRLDHYNTRAQRCLLGFKGDGTIVYMSTAGRDQEQNDNAYGLTIPQLGQIAIQMGCVTAYNLDGGGSTQMIISENGGDFEYAHKSLEKNYGRLVANCIYVVKKQSTSNSNGVKAALQTLVDENKDSTVQTVKDAVAEANAVLANTKSMDGDYTRVYMRLKLALSGKAELDSAIASASGISYKDYSPTVLNMIWDAYNTALSIRGDENATADQISKATKQLNNLINMKGTAAINISKGKSYTKVGGAYDAEPKYADTGNVELTDGTIAPSGNFYGAEWVGFHSSYKGGTEDGAPYYDVTIDLGKIESNLTEFKVYSEHEWSSGIEAPTKIVVSVSEDGQSFTEAGLATTNVSLVRSDADKSDSTKKQATDVVYTLTLTTGVQGQYVKFHMVGGKSKIFMFITELEVYKTDKPIEKALYLTGMNAKINTNDSFIFTHDYADELTGDNANLNWAFAIAAQWDDVKKAYIVVQTASGNGGNAIKKVPKNGFVLGVHGDSGTGSVNKQYASTAKFGDIISLNGIDVESKIILPGAYIQFSSSGSTDAILKAESGVKFENSYARGVRDKTTVTDLQNMFYGTVVVRNASGNVITGNKNVGTGATINTGSIEYTVVVIYDLDGDGDVDVLDGMKLKRAIIHTYQLTELQEKASSISGKSYPIAIDYLRLKKYLLGNYKIYDN